MLKLKNALIQNNLEVQAQNYNKQIQIKIYKMRKSFCIQSVATFNQINKAITNNSISKNLWTFNKEPRFAKTKIYCDKIYEIQGMKPKKYGIGIGKGQKSDFTRDLTISPSATRYTRKSFFQQNKHLNKGYKIINERQNSPQNNYIQLEPLKVPGPGAYSQKKPNKGFSYTMRLKTKVINKLESIQPQNQYPGPGSYQNPEALAANGKYTISKNSVTSTIFFSPQKSARFLPINKQIPGPGQYKIPQTLNKQSKYINSKNQGTGARKFSIEKKKSTFDQIAKLYKINPGPGSYRKPSEFGQYDGNVYDRKELIQHQRFVDKKRLSIH